MYFIHPQHINIATPHFKKRRPVESLLMWRIRYCVFISKQKIDRFYRLAPNFVSLHHITQRKCVSMPWGSFPLLSNTRNYLEIDSTASVWVSNRLETWTRTWGGCRLHLGFTIWHGLRLGPGFKNGRAIYVYTTKAVWHRPISKNASLLETWNEIEPRV